METAGDVGTRIRSQHPKLQQMQWSKKRALIGHLRSHSVFHTRRLYILSALVAFFATYLYVRYQETSDFEFELNFAQEQRGQLQYMNGPSFTRASKTNIVWKIFVCPPSKMNEQYRKKLKELIPAVDLPALENSYTAFKRQET